MAESDTLEKPEVKAPTAKAEAAPVPKIETPAAGDDGSWGRLLDLTMKNLESGSEMQDRLSGLSDRYAAFGKEIATRPVPTPPKTPDLPEPPKADITSPFQAFGSMASTLALVGSLATRKPLTAALRAIARAVNGVRENDLRNYKLSMDQWATETDHALRMAKLENQRYTAIIANQQYSDDQKLNLLKADAALLKDQNMLRLAQTGDIRAVSDMIYRRGLLANQAQANAGRLKTDQVALNTFIEEYRQANDGQDPPAHMIAEFLSSLPKKNQSAMSQAFELWKKENPDGNLDQFAEYFQKTKGSLSFEQRKELQELKDKAAGERVDKQQEGATERARIAAARDPIEAAWQNYQRNNPGKSFDDFSAWYTDIHGRMTADQRTALQEVKDKAALERAKVVAGAGYGPGVPKKVGEKASERIPDAVDTIQRLDEGVAGIMQTPNAIGVKGYTVDKLGGLIQQMEEGLGIRGAVSSQWDIDQVRDVRSKLENSIGKLIPTITGDTSGRYSNQDRKIADDAFAALRATSSADTALVSLSVIRDIAMRGLLRDLKLAGPAGKSIMDQLGLTEEQLQSRRFAELMGKNGEYEYASIWMDGGQLYARKADGTVGRLKWR